MKRCFDLIASLLLLSGLLLPLLAIACLQVLKLGRPVFSGKPAQASTAGPLTS